MGPNALKVKLPVFAGSLPQASDRLNAHRASKESRAFL